MANYSDQTIVAALEAIQRRRFVLPAIQREFVWGPDQICTLFDSLMRGYPVGSLLYWDVREESSANFRWYGFVRDYHEYDAPDCPRLDDLPSEDRVAVLDGQQRLTALNIGLRGSYAERARYQRVGKPDSYPTKRLFLDICAEPRPADDRKEGLSYRFAFLEPEEADARTSAVSLDGEKLAEEHWFPVPRILELDSEDFGAQVHEYLVEHELGNHRHAFRALNGLAQMTFKERHLSFFTVENQDLDRVLDIFIRVNSQGEPLSKSDLLMSIATAQWKGRDAREEIPTTVARINGISPGFAFTRDNVLKAGLVLAGFQEIGFRARTFTRPNMERLEEAWDDVTRTLYRSVELLASFGLSEHSIAANMVIIPVAYYMHARGLDDSYLSSAAEAEDRQRVRDWVIRSLLQPGVFGSGLDTLLGRLRRAIDEHGDEGFPSEAIESEMSALGKSLNFSEGTVDGLIDTRYGRPIVVPLLSILYSHISMRDRHHVDHVFPQALLKHASLRRAGLGEEEIERISRECRDGLANLQLLPGPENIGKSDKLPLEWATRQYPGSALSGYLEQNDMLDLPSEPSGFVEFYDARRARLRERLLAVLSRPPGSLDEGAAEAAVSAEP